MPILVPTPEELATMTWHQRDRVLAKLRAYERELGMYVAPVRTTRTDDGDDAKRRADRAWGAMVQQQAREQETYWNALFKTEGVV